MSCIVSDFLSKNFFPGFKITNISFSEVSDKDITIELEPAEPPVCPHCCSHNVVVHEYRQRVIKDEKLLGCFVTLVITYRTVKCNYCECKYATEDIPFLSDSFRVTKRAEESVIEDLEMAGSIKDTSRRTGLSWDVCKNIHKRYLQSTISFSLGSSEFLAIDEFSIKKGHKYGTVVADIVTKRVIWVCEGKSNTEVSRFFELCGKIGCQQIKAVAMDQNAGFASLVKRYCSKALVVYDLFHMVYNFGRLVISAIRIRLANYYRDHGDEAGYELLKGSRFLLLTRNSRLSEEKKLRLDSILSYYSELNMANELKELLPEVYEANSKDEAERLWTEWVRLAMSSGVEEIMKFAKSQNDHYRDGITNAGIYHIRTSVLEGINNKIKVLKRVAYGYRDLDYFFLRIRSAFRGKFTPIPTIG